MIGAGMELLCAGYIADAGTAWLLRHHRRALAARYSARYLSALEESLEAARAVMAAAGLGEPGRQAALSVRAAQPIGVGGALAALWDLCEQAAIQPDSGRKSGVRLGCQYRLRDFPLLQGSIELSEQFGLSPYRLWTRDAWLFATENAWTLCERLRAEGVPCAVIGMTTEGRGRLRTDGEETAYLTKRHKDELELLGFSPAQRGGKDAGY